MPNKVAQEVFMIVNEDGTLYKKNTWTTPTLYHTLAGARTVYNYSIKYRKNAVGIRVIKGTINWDFETDVGPRN